MRREDDRRPFRNLIDVFDRPGPLVLKGLDHIGIMDDLVLDEHRVWILLERQLHNVYCAYDSGAESSWDTENDFQLKTPLCTMDGYIGIVSHHMIPQVYYTVAKDSPDTGT